MFMVPMSVEFAMLAIAPPVRCGLRFRVPLVRSVAPAAVWPVAARSFDALHSKPGYCLQRFWLVRARLFTKKNNHLA